MNDEVEVDPFVVPNLPEPLLAGGAAGLVDRFSQSR